MAKGFKSGGRRKGTPNKDNPIKGYLLSHSIKYFQPGENGISQFEEDLDAMEPAERVASEIKILKHHTPEMKATDITASVERKKTIEDRLRELSGETDDEL